MSTRTEAAILSSADGEPAHGHEHFLVFIVLAICLALAFVARSSPGTPAAMTIGVLPIGLILGLLFMQVNMLVAALAGGVMAMIIGSLGLDVANKGLTEAVPKMLSITVPIINSAIAMAVFQAAVTPPR